MSEDIVGLWAVCGAGSIGLVKRIGTRRGQKVALGMRMDGSTWQSYVPLILCEKDQKFLRATVGDADER